jgi:hypothetical protein
MDAAIVIGLTGVVAGFASAFATLYVARRGGTFRQRSPALSIGGYSLANGRETTVVYGVPADRGNILSSLMLELSNPGNDTIDDIVLTIVVPHFMGGFFDEEKGKPNVTFSVSRGIDPGTSTKAERVGIHEHLHFTIKSIHSLSGAAIEIPVCFPGAMGKLKFTVPVTFKGGETADLQMQAQITIPIEILLMARNRRTQHFTIDLELYAPPVFGFRPLAWEWLAGFVSHSRELRGIRKRIAYWSRAAFGFHRCLLVMPQYHQTEIKSPSKKSKDKPLTVLQEVPGSKRYATGYLVSLFAFYRPIKRKPLVK